MQSAGTEASPKKAGPKAAEGKGTAASEQIARTGREGKTALERKEAPAVPESSAETGREEAAGMGLKDENGREAGLPDGSLLERVALHSPYNNVSLNMLTYLSQGLRVKGYLACPAGKEPSPGLIYCRGGIRKVGMVRKRRILSMAKRGYAVFAPFYRGNEGGEGREDFGGEDRFDVCHALTLMQSLPEVKPGLLPLIGFSRGAIMAMLAARDCTQAGPVVVWGGVSDLFDTYEERVDLRRMLKRVVGHPRKQPEEYESRSPVHWLERIQVPVLIVHGTADSQVNVAQAAKLAEGLERAGKDFAVQLHEGMDHRFPREEEEKALDAVFHWISQKLMRLEKP